MAVLEKELFQPELLNALSKSLQPATSATPASLLITGGTIRPLINGSTETVEALGIHGGKVVAAGTLAAVQAALSSQGITYTTRQLSAGQTLLPGLIEPHVHIVPTAMTGGWLSLNRISGQNLMATYDTAWMTQTLQAYVAQAGPPNGNWVLAKSVDPSLMPFEGSNLVTFTNTMLDAMVSDRPLFILSASMHTAYVNTAALQLTYAQLSPQEKATYPKFEDYENATQGQLQEEVGMAPALKALPQQQKTDMLLGMGKHLSAFFQEASSRGVTFLYDAGMTPKYKGLLQLYLAVAPKKTRIGAARICFTQADVEAMGAYQTVTAYDDIYYGHAKLVSDGSNQGLTGYQSTPYDCQAINPRGIFNLVDPNDPQPSQVPDVYTQMVQSAVVSQGWPLMIHANGDLAVKFALQVYSAAIPKQKDPGLRHRIEHCSLLIPEQLATLRQYGISPSFLIGHVGYWGYAFSQIIFKDKAQHNLDLSRSALAAGLRISLHSDCEVSPMGPLRMMEQSITRRMEAAPVGPNGVPPALNADECLSAEQALLAVTRDAAWQCYADAWVGALDTGMFADFVILAQDPLTLSDPYLKMRDIPVVETWKDGAPTYTGGTTGA
ncbi:amidohydrolase [Melittangium boletus]|uniref:amidohydrolase n=1 Tax=Melittangium boletus TaxID=83453 RepID=UPI003DA536CF